MPICDKCGEEREQGYKCYPCEVKELTAKVNLYEIAAKDRDLFRDKLKVAELKLQGLADDVEQTEEKFSHVPKQFRMLTAYAVMKLKEAVLQNGAMRRALTDVMRFSSDDRSRAVAKGILDAHGGPDPKDPAKQRCTVIVVSDVQENCVHACGHDLPCKYHPIAEKKKCECPHHQKAPDLKSCQCCGQTVGQG
jgi:hypothetical protein